MRLLRAGVPAVRGEGDLAMKRILALDVGDKRTGVAVSDELGITAQGVETIQTRGLERDAQRVAQLAGEYGTERILIGLPRKLDYSEGAQAEHSRAFGDKLAEMGFSVRYEDERLTTAMAQRALLEGDASYLTIQIDIRHPVTLDEQETARRLGDFFTGHGFTLENLSARPGLYYPMEHPLVATLQGVYNEVTGESGAPIAIGGGTYVHHLKNGVAFGCSMPGTDNKMHGADEFAVIEDLIISAKMFAQVIVNLCE